jgi:recombination protein RecR
MSYLPNFIKKLIEEFDKFPSIGPKTASRLIFNLLHRKDDIKILSDALNEAYEKIHFCPQCFNLTDEGLCNICNDIKRDKKNICIVSNNQDVEAIEKTKEFNGTYHLLNGLLSPLEGITPDKLRIKELLNRIKKDNVKEIILALDQSIEGEATIIYISKLLKDFDIKITKLARGIPMGANIEYTDEITLSSALKNRKEI